MTTLRRQDLVEVDDNLQFSRRVAKYGLKKNVCLMCAFAIFGVLLILAISLSGFLMTYSTQEVFLAQGFMSNMLTSVAGNLKNILRPFYTQLRNEMSQIRGRGLDLTTWEGLSSMDQTPFLANVCKLHRCTHLALANMAFDAADVNTTGGVDQWHADHIRTDDWGDDALGLGSVVNVRAFGNATQPLRYKTVDEAGHFRNNWTFQLLDTWTFQTTAWEIPMPGPVRQSWLEHIWTEVHGMDLQPLEAKFTSVWVFDFVAPKALFVSMIMPVYEQSEMGGSSDRRVAALTFGFELPLLSRHLASMKLQGGFVFLVEESTGYLLAASDEDVDVLVRDGEMVRPDESAHSLIRGAAEHLKSTGDWPTLSNELVQGEIEGVTHFFQCFLFEHYGFSVVGVYVVRSSLVLGSDLVTNVVIGILFNLTCTVVLVLCIFSVVCYRFQKLRRHTRDQKRALQHMIQEMALATGIANKLANYDLSAAGEFLKEQDPASDLAKPLRHLLDTLTSYNAFFPDGLFLSVNSDDLGLAVPNTLLASAMRGQRACLPTVRSCASQLRNPGYTLLNYTHDIRRAFPELALYTTSRTLSSGLSGDDEYERTMGAFYALYCMLRLDLDGKEIMSFGVDAAGIACCEPQDNFAKKREFHLTMNWDAAADLVRKADLLRFDARGRTVIRHERVVAMLVLTAVHDVMKNTSLLPLVLPDHAPYQGHGVNDCINDHDIALAYVLDYFPFLLPSFNVLEPGQRAPILFTQGKMGFNNGWLVQGEAPPALLFSRFKQVIVRGRASQADISFYFVHWFTDLAGAETFQGKPWPGAEKFTTKFPVHVLGSFLDSFSFVDRLASRSEVQVMEDYLASRWHARGLSPLEPTCENTIALQRLVLMAQGFEKEIFPAFFRLPPKDQLCLTQEFARTGHEDQFDRAPASVLSPAQGPALMLYYAPALMQKAGPDQCLEAMLILAAVFRAARRLFPCVKWSVGSTTTIRIDALKVLSPAEIAQHSFWHVIRKGDMEAEVTGDVCSELSSSIAPLDLNELHSQLPMTAESVLQIGC